LHNRCEFATLKPERNGGTGYGRQYRHIIGYLSDLSTYPGGQKATKELAEYWHVYHRNRPAMKDELRQAGYPQK
jgi:hypothetical protein